MTGKSDKSIVLSKRFLAVLLLALGPLFVLQYHRNVQIEIQFQVLQNSVNGIETKLSDLEYLLRGLDEKLSYRDEDKPAGRLLENGVYDIPDHAPHSRYLYNLETLKEDSRIPVNVDREFSYDDFKPIFEVDPLHQIVFTPKVLELIDDHNATTDEYYADYADDIEMYQKKFHDLLDAESLEERDREYMTVKWVSVFEGFGVFAKKDIKEGDLIGRYTGEVKLDNPNTDYTWTYMTTEINGEYVDLGVDGENRGNYLRFINHKGEDRNCEAEYVIHKNRWM